MGQCVARQEEKSKKKDNHMYKEAGAGKKKIRKPKTKKTKSVHKPTLTSIKSQQMLEEELRFMPSNDMNVPVEIVSPHKTQSASSDLRYFKEERLKEDVTDDLKHRRPNPSIYQSSLFANDSRRNLDFPSLQLDTVERNRGTTVVLEAELLRPASAQSNDDTQWKFHDIDLINHSSNGRKGKRAVALNHLAPTVEDREDPLFHMEEAQDSSAEELIALEAYHSDSSTSNENDN